MLITLFAFMIAASYRAWRDEYHAALREQEKLSSLTIPHLDGTLETVSAGPWPGLRGESLLFMLVHVTNQGAPSIADVVSCKIHTASGKEAIAKFPILAREINLMFGNASPKQAITYPRAENFMVEALNSPIPSGGALGGFVALEAPGINWTEIMQSGTVVTLTLHDVRGSKVELKHIVNASDTRVRVMSEEDEEEANDE